MKRFFIYSIALTAFLTTPILSMAQSVSVVSKSDSMTLWVGDQTRIHVEATFDTGKHAEFPHFKDTIINGLEIVPPVITDTQYLNNKKRIQVTRHYTVTSFDSANFYIPPFAVSVDSTIFYSNDLSLTFYMMDVDTLNPDVFFGPKSIVPMPLKWEDVDTSVYSFLLFGLLIVLGIFLIFRLIDNKPIIRIVKLEPKLPPHEKALSMIERLRVSKRAHDNDPKSYYTDLTDILRQYMKERFMFDATEMTSDEIIECLKDCNDSETLNDMKMMLSTADLVKFAKYVPMLNENDQNLLNAVDFVKKTLIEPDPNTPQKLEEKVIEEKRSKGARIALMVLIIVICIGCVTSLFILIQQLYYLFF